MTILHISFCNAKWTWISLENLMIELYLHKKIHLYYFPGRLEYAELRKSLTHILRSTSKIF